MPWRLAEALQTKQTRRAGEKIRRDTLRTQRGQRLSTLFQLRSRDFLQFRERRRKRLDIQIGDDIRLLRCAAKTGEIAAERQTSTIINIHARTGQRRTRRAVFVDIVVTDV